SPQALTDAAAAAPGEPVPAVEYAATDAQQVRWVAAVPTVDSVPDDWLQDDCSAAPRADDHSALVAPPDDCSAQVDSAAHDSAPVCSAGADSAQDDCSAAPRADDHSALVAPPDDCSAQVDSAAHDSAPVCSAGADSAQDDCSAAPRADDHSALVAPPDDCSAQVDCSERGGSAARYLRPDARS